MHKTVNPWRTWFVCGVMLALTNFCQAAGESDKAKAVVESSLRIEMIDTPREVELPTQFYLAMRLANPTSKAVLFKSFEIKPLEEPGGLKVANCLNTQQMMLMPSASLTILCPVSNDAHSDTMWGFLSSIFGSWSLMTLQPGEYRFVATAQLRDDSLGQVTINTTIPVKIRPTVWQVSFGAAFGALLLVVFAFSSPATRKLLTASERMVDASGLKKWVGEPLLLWVSATVSSSMFIFMTYRLKDVSGPFTITVNDFYGGVVIGLFGVFLADWLASKLFASAKTST